MRRARTSRGAWSHSSSATWSSISPEIAAEVRALFDLLRATGVAPRVLAYGGYVKPHPRGKYAVVLYEEAAKLRRLVAFDNGGGDTPQHALRNFQPPREARSHTPLRI